MTIAGIIEMYMFKKLLKYVLLFVSIVLIAIAVLGFRESGSYESIIQENNDRLAEVNFSYSGSSDMISDLSYGINTLSENAILFVTSGNDDNIYKYLSEASDPYNEDFPKEGGMHKDHAYELYLEGDYSSDCDTYFYSIMEDSRMMMSIEYYALTLACKGYETELYDGLFINDLFKEEDKELSEEECLDKAYVILNDYMISDLDMTYMQYKDRVFENIDLFQRSIKDTRDSRAEYINGVIDRIYVQQREANNRAITFAIAGILCFAAAIIMFVVEASRKKMEKAVAKLKAKSVKNKPIEEASVEEQIESALMSDDVITQQIPDVIPAANDAVIEKEEILVAEPETIDETPKIEEIKTVKPSIDLDAVLGDLDSVFEDEITAQENNGINDMIESFNAMNTQELKLDNMNEAPEIKDKEKDIHMDAIDDIFSDFDDFMKD